MTLQPLCFTDKCLMPYYGGCPYDRECIPSETGVSCGDCLPGLFEYSDGVCIGISSKNLRRAWDNSLMFRFQK